MRAENAIFHLSREHIYNEVARQEAIKALKKQIPKKPLEQKYGFCDLVGFFNVRLVCPECEQPIARYFNKKEYKPRHCHNCGQALDWSDDNG